MTPESWERVQELYARVRDLGAAEREPILAAAAREHPDEVDTVRRLLELEPPSRFIEPIGGGVRAERFFGGGLAGTRLGDFLLEAEIGRGGMGVVYRATQLGLGRQVAVKVLPVAALGRERTLERFRREAKAASELDHPCIVDVLAYGEDGQTAWFAMRWIDGHDLGAEIGLQASKEDPGRCLLPLADTERFLAVAVQRMAEIADAVHYAHEQGIVHRDIKPQNILLDRAGRMHLADFGLAKSERLGTLSRTAEVHGTPHYMSPEQVRAVRDAVDHRTDVYSLGVVLYELFVRRRPFQADTPVLVMHAITSEEPRRPTKIDPSLPVALETICLRAMEKRAGDRYASAHDLAEDLRRFLRGEPIAAKPQSTLVRLRRRAGRHGRVAAGLGAGALAVGAAWSGAGVYRDRADDVRLRVALESDVDATGARVSVIELDPDFGTRHAMRAVGRWPVGWVRLEPGCYRCVIELEGYGSCEVDFDLREPASAKERSARLWPRAEVLAGMPDVPGGRVVLWYPDYADPGGPRSRAHFVHEVAPFHLDVLPVTHRQYAQYLAESGATPPPGWPAAPDAAWLDKPACDLTLEEAQAYAEFHGKRLPTLAEMQLAARGPQGWRFPWGNEPGEHLQALQLGRPEVGRHDDYPDSPEGTRLWFDQHVRAAGNDPADTAGPFGHRDLLGNVAVWTSTPLLHLVGGRPERDPDLVVLAGVPSFRSLASVAREGLDERMAMDPRHRPPFVGLRCAVSARPDALDPLPHPTESAAPDAR